MDWTDCGIVVGMRRHGETGVIIEALTRHHGRHSGFVPGGRSRRLRPVLQPGNGVELAWRSRVEEQLGAFTVEPLRQRAAGIMASAAALHAVQHLCALVRLLAEREPHDALHDRLDTLLDRLDAPAGTPAAMACFELTMLRELGFGLDLTRCAASGSTADLVFVSPKSGRAVSAVAGAPYADRLLRLPAFLRGEADDNSPDEASPDDVAAGFRLTGFFLERDVFGPRGQTLPEARAAYLRAVTAVPQ